MQMPTVCMTGNAKEFKRIWHGLPSVLPGEFDSQILCKWITATQSHLSLVVGFESGAKFTSRELELSASGALTPHTVPLACNLDPLPSTDISILKPKWICDYFKWLKPQPKQLARTRCSLVRNCQSHLKTKLNKVLNKHARGAEGAVQISPGNPNPPRLRGVHICSLRATTRLISFLIFPSKDGKFSCCWKTRGNHYFFVKTNIHFSE